jgi:hypothetical protein
MPKRVRKSDGQQEALKRAREAAAETLRLRHAADASSAAAPVDSGTDPPPAGRFRCSCRTPITQVRSNRTLQVLPLLRTLHPQQSYHSESGGNAAHPPLPTYVSSYLPVEATALLTHAPMRRAVTRAATALRYTAVRCASCALEGTVLRCSALHCTCTAPCSALAVVAVVYANCIRAHAALWGRLVTRKRW